MAKLSIFFLLCSLSVVLGNLFYYQNVPAVSGALSYPYVGFEYAPYAMVAPQADCDKEKGGESSSSESSSEESSSSESSEEGEKKEEKESGEEGGSKEGEEKEGSEEKKESEEKEGSSSSSSSSEESKEGEGEKKEKKEEKKKEKEEKPLFPPRTYSFPAPVQQVVYAQQPYMRPYKTYSIIPSAPVSYQVKSAYVAAPYATPMKSIGSPVTKIFSGAPAAASVVSIPAAKSYSTYSNYMNPASGYFGLPSYYANNVAYYKA